MSKKTQVRPISTAKSRRRSLACNDRLLRKALAVRPGVGRQFQPLGPVGRLETAKTALAYLADPQLWFESFQNGQSEFLSTATLVVLSIFLRQMSSPESKPVAAPDSQTGA